MNPRTSKYRNSRTHTLKAGYRTLAAVLLLAGLLGCRGPSDEAPSELVRRARLVGNENLQLKKQLKRIEKENAALQGEHSEKLEYQHQLDLCRQDLADAPMPCPEVEAQYTQLVESLGELLIECQQKLEKYEPESTE